MPVRAAVLLAILCAAPLAAQDAPEPPEARRTMRLTLRECVHLALRNGLDIEIARFQPWIDDESAVSAEGSFDHILYSRLDGGRSSTATDSALSGATELNTDRLSQRTGIRRTLPIGMSWDLYFQTDRSETNSSFATVNPRWTQSLGTTVTLPLLKGRGETAAYNAVLVARQIRRIDALGFEQTLVDQILAVHQAYWNLVFASEQKRLRELSLQVAVRLLDDTRKKFERGIVARVDVTEADSGVASQQEGILTAENELQDAMDRLKRLIDPSLLRTEVDLVPADAPAPPESPLDEAAAVAKALEEAHARRPEVRRNAEQLALQDLTLARTRNARLPKLDLTATAGVSGLEDSFGQAASETGDAQSWDWSLALVFELPLEGRADGGAWRKAELERRRLLLERRNLEDQLLVEIREAAREVKTTEKRIEATRKATALAREQLEGELNRKEQGLRTTFHVLEAESRVLESASNAVKALIDHQLAIQQLHRAAGTLLERNAVVLEEQLLPRTGLR